MDDPEDWPTGRLLSTAARLVEHAWNERLARHGLTHAGVIALHVLAGGPLPQTELAASCQVEDQTMSRTLERLEREGYVTRSRDPRDRRRLLVARTASGTRAWRRAVELEREVVPALGDPEEFRRQLLTIIAALHEARWPGPAPGPRQGPAPGPRQGPDPGQGRDPGRDVG